MSGLRVLNTRPRDQAAELSQLLRQAGYRPFEVPAIEVVSAWDAGELGAAAARLNDHAYTWVVFSSANAARFSSGSLGPAALEGAQLLCGEATARSFGLNGALMLPRFSARAALDALESRVRPGERVLVPRAAEGREELVSGLRARGVLVDSPVCYRTVAARIPRWEPVDAITLCSPSALAALAAAWSAELINRSTVVCLGETTAEAARAAGVRVDATAQLTSMPALVAALDSVAGARV